MSVIIAYFTRNNARKIPPQVLSIWYNVAMKLTVAFIFAHVAYACLAGASAAPDAALLNQAREEARTLLTDDFRRLNTGRATLLEVAERVADMASADTNSSALQRILQEGAFNMYRGADNLRRAAERRVPFWINLGSDAEFEFAACPAGSFTMGFEGDPASAGFRHKVNFSRPFWIARHQTTKRLYDTFRKLSEMSDEEKAYGGMDSPVGGIPRVDIDAFCDFLTMRNRNRIPEGYVFRLPTDAEWEYALNADCVDPKDPYVRFKNGDMSVAAEISVVLEDVNDARVRYGLVAITTKDWVGPVFAVGTKRPNAWGLYDMLGNGAEMVLDTLPTNAVKVEFGEGRIGRENVHNYQDEETDPLRFAGTENVLLVLRGRPRWTRFAASWYCRTVRIDYPRWSRGQVFRVALAPDILAERTAKEAAR